MSKLSVVIITKNEEEMIADCIDSVSFADEIVVIDSGSTDRTIDIAEKMGARVYKVSTTNFADMRNEGLKRARYDWILYIDADERISDKLRETINSQLSTINNQKNTTVAYRLKRKNFYLGNHEWPMVERLERLFLKKHLKGWYGTVHETAKVDGEVGELEGYLLHYTHRDLTSMVNKTIAWSDIEAKLRFDSGHPRMAWWRFPRVMATAFYDSYIRQKGYTVGVVGVVESVFQAFSMFITYAKLWELQQQHSKK